jgi:hypothetical protein
LNGAEWNQVWTAHFRLAIKSIAFKSVRQLEGLVLINQLNISKYINQSIIKILINN